MVFSIAKKSIVDVNVQCLCGRITFFLIALIYLVWCLNLNVFVKDSGLIDWDWNLLYRNSSNNCSGNVHLFLNDRVLLRADVFVCLWSFNDFNFFIVLSNHRVIYIGCNVIVYIYVWNRIIIDLCVLRINVYFVI